MVVKSPRRNRWTAKAVSWVGGPLVIVAVGLLLSSCTPKPYTITIHYRQIFNAYRIMPEDAKSKDYRAANGLFAFFQITRISNTEADAADFIFNLDKIYVQNGTNEDSPLGRDGPLRTASDDVINAGSEQSTGGEFVIDVHADVNADQRKAFALNYRGSPREQVKFVRDQAVRPNRSASAQEIAKGEVYWFNEMSAAAFKDFLECNRKGDLPGGCTLQYAPQS